MNLKLLYLSSFFLFLFLCIMIIYIKKNTRGKYTSELKVSILLYYDKNNTYIQSLLYNLVKYNINAFCFSSSKTRTSYMQECSIVMSFTTY